MHVELECISIKVKLKSITNALIPQSIKYTNSPGRVALVVSESASHAVGRGFAPHAGHTKDHHKDGTYCLNG